MTSCSIKSDKAYHEYKPRAERPIKELWYEPLFVLDQPHPAATHEQERLYRHQQEDRVCDEVEVLDKDDLIGAEVLP